MEGWFLSLGRVTILPLTDVRVGVLGWWLLMEPSTTPTLPPQRLVLLWTVFLCSSQIPPSLLFRGRFLPDFPVLMIMRRHITHLTPNQICTVYTPAVVCSYLVVEAGLPVYYGLCRWDLSY